MLGLFDFEKARFDRRKSKPFTLGRVKEALALLGNPSQDKALIHIAGTKGKGSVAHLLHWSLMGQGLGPVGLFTSPHLVHLSERIRIGHDRVSPLLMSQWAERLHRINDDHFEGALTFFEFLFLMAMGIWESEACPWGVVEVGLGGRLDATNAISPRVAVITRIDYDHCEILGDTLEKIAGEKGGIIKPGVPVVALRQGRAVEAVFQEKAAEVGATLHWAEASVGDPERENLNLAHRTLEVLDMKDHALGGSSLQLPGRFQRVDWRKGKWLLDVAHNSLACSTLAPRLGQYGEHLIFAMSEERDTVELLKPFIDRVQEASFVPLPGGRPGVDPDQCLSTWKALGGRGRVSRLEEVLAQPKGHHVVTGSFYLVGEVMAKMGLEAKTQSAPR